MSDFEDKLNSLMNDPKQMEKIAAMAKSLMGEKIDSASPEKESENADTGMVKAIAKLVGNTENGSNKRTTLLNAMKPYLSEKRRGKMDKAIKIARLAEIAQLAADEYGGDENV